MKHTGLKEKLSFSALCVLLLCIAVFAVQNTAVNAQTRTHDLGDYKYFIKTSDVINTNSDRTGHYPQDVYNYYTAVWYMTGLSVGSWYDTLGVEHTKENSVWATSFTDPPYGVTEYRRAEPPEVWVYTEGQMLLSSRRFNGIVDTSIPSDIMINLHYKAEPGFDVLKKTYSFSNQNHDDYVIYVNRYKATYDWDRYDGPDADTSKPIKDVYVLLAYGFQNTEGSYIVTSQWYASARDDWGDYEVYSPELVSGVRDMVVGYCWDGDDPGLVEFESGGPTFDDTGDPRFGRGSGGSVSLPSGEFVSYAYGGFAALHVDTSPTDKTDNYSQPVSVVCSFNVFDVWDETVEGYATIWDWASSGTKQSVEQVAGWPDDPTLKTGDEPMMAFGPYDFNMGDSITVVYAVGAGGISRALAIDKGLEWRSWYRGEDGATFDDASKNALIATGKDSLFQNLDRAMFAYSRGLDVPDPLPAPDLTVTSGPNRIELEWEDLSDVGDFDTGVPDLDHYNIYRKRGEFLEDKAEELREDGTHIRWEKIAEVPGTQTTYIDNTVTRGEAYHYAVTAVDDGTQNTDGLIPGQKLESSKYANRSEIAAYGFQPGAETAQSVRIVPNPYILRAGDFNFTGEDDKLLIVNLPPYCTIRIFTATGDLIKTIEHESGSADESWDQVTESNQLLASGVYILQIDNARNLNEESIDGSIEKFVVIR